MKFNQSAWILLFFVLFAVGSVWGTTVAVHDPSIVVVYKDANGSSYPVNDLGQTRTKYYYIFGTQLGAAYSTDMIDWTPFTPSFSVGGQTTPDYLKAFQEAATWSGHTTVAKLRENLWAPDVIWNKKLGKWCMYYSVNGDDWKSSVVLHTADRIEGPYEFSGFVVFSGMDHTSSGPGNADYQKVTGSAVVDNRYLNNGQWKGDYGSSCIDPAVLYDEDGKLWLVYGSWSGGIFVLKLDENTGLRDYTYNYGFGNTPQWEGTSLRYDPYMGVHIAGGYYVSGEGPYVEYLVDNNGVGYYYLFISMGFYSPEGGYSMRVFRSPSLLGKFTDVTGNDAVFSKYVFNYGNNVQYGFPIMQNYKWSWWNQGEVAQGHNSVLRDDDGRSYLIYHRKLDDGSVHHNVEVHELLFNDQGWVLAAPFEYRKDMVSTPHALLVDQIIGPYGVIAHQPVDYANLATNQEQALELHADGAVTGAFTGSWEYRFHNGTHYINLVTSAGTFRGVIQNALINDVSTQTLTFTAMNPTNERALWGYQKTNTRVGQRHDYESNALVVGASDYSLAWDDYELFYQDTASGDFEMEFIFDNHTLGLENWHNWAVIFETGNEQWYLRGDAWSNSEFSGSLVSFKTDWTANVDYKTAYESQKVRVQILRMGQTMHVLAYAGENLIFTAKALNTPSGLYKVYLGGEACRLDIQSVSVNSLEPRQKVGTVSGFGTYTNGFRASQSPVITVQGDFNLHYEFYNYRNSKSSNNWDNYMVQAQSGGQTMLLRADAYALDAWGEISYESDWSWDDFLQIMQGAFVDLQISRQKDVITYSATITAVNGEQYHYHVRNTGAPLGEISFALTNEYSMTDIIRVERTRYTKAPEDPGTVALNPVLDNPMLSSSKTILYNSQGKKYWSGLGEPIYPHAGNWIVVRYPSQGGAPQSQRVHVP